ncbi:Dipeptidyl peptidase family member 6 [Trichuris trichiura]|uniref:Dipeptidyl peptidase family member 6 n=1 Tax=Trichuris trichiura TaxID=36087 RepID=A0A077ZM57_TRITR|nr:Dipeptidyl peptidase family member 6 [Trichuris trichiura]
MQWNFPNMPWDATELWMANLAEDGSTTSGAARKILSTAGTSYMQPKFSEDGELYFISDESNWWNLYKYSSIELSVKYTNEWRYPYRGGVHLSIHAFDAEVEEELNIVNRKSDLCYRQETGYFEHSYIAFGQDRCIYCIASDATKFQAVIRWNVLYGVTDVIERVHEELDATLISVPELIAFPPALSESEEDGQPITIYGYFYNPVNPLYKPLRGSLPPLLVLAHGGPTSRCGRSLDLRVQYYTSRGFAVLNVDYRGSSGYGRKYRELLKSKLGVYDVDDCCSGAVYLAEEGKVDPNMLCISGRSAGGFVVLASLAFKNVFSAGVCHYGISDLVALQESSCKYEMHYFDNLVAPYPDHITTYRERSPVNFVERIRAPVAFFHGTDDKIVPVDQIKRMHELLKRKGLMTSLVLFEGEGHGYRTDSNIRTALDGEYNFFCQALDIKTECLTHKESIGYGTSSV